MKNEIVTDTLGKHLDKIGSEICALLNDKGGSFSVPLKELGLPSSAFSEKELASWESYIRSHLKPSALFSMIRNQNSLQIEVPQHWDLPYAYQDVVYVLEEKKIVKADINTVRDMIQRRQVEPERWERRFSSADMGKELDLNHIQEQLDSIKSIGRVALPSLPGPEELLSFLSVLKYGRLTNAGDVLFSHNTALRYPQVRIKATRFAQDKTDAEYKDMKEFEGPLLKVLEEAYLFILRNTATRVSFSKNVLARKEQSQYPKDAIREALVNALVHRDYSDYAGSVQVNIYPQRLEIVNSGAFLEGITPETMEKGSASVLRNPDIAHIVYLNGMMEKTGRGSLLIIKACLEQGLAKPIWRSEQGVGVTLVLGSGDKNIQVDIHDDIQVSIQVRKLLHIISDEVSMKEILEKIGLKSRINLRKNYLMPALEQDLIEMTRPEAPQSRLQKYRLTPKGKALQEKLRKMKKQ